MVGDFCIEMLSFAIRLSIVVSFLLAILRGIWSSYGQQCIQQLVMFLLGHLREHMRTELTHAIFTDPAFENLANLSSKLSDKRNGTSVHDAVQPMSSLFMGPDTESTLWHAAFSQLAPLALPLMWRLTCRLFPR